MPDVRYSIDTRSIKPGEYYVAIIGEKYDGHDFIDDALGRGAAGLVVEKDIDAPDGVEVVRVDDCERYLAEKAQRKLADLNTDIVAITGSVGKTSTKNAIVTVLSQAYDVVASSGNLNTILGLSLTLLNAECTPETRFVLEMGATHARDIASKCHYFRPTVSVVTNVQPVHLESFGSMDVIEKTKGELVDALDAEGVAVLNYDDPRVRRMATRNAGRTVFFGKEPGAEVGPDALRVEIPLLGEHAAYTALAAFCVGKALGVPDDAIDRGLLALKPEKGRLARLQGRNGMVLIDDTYNASPSAVLMALAAMRKVEGKRYVAFLGDMLELGEVETEEHQRVIKAAADLADEVYLSGRIMGRVAEGMPAEIRERLTLYPTSTEIATGIAEGRIYTPGEGDVVLVKGSQGARMEHVSKALLHPDVDPADVLPRQTKSWLG